MQVIIQIKCDNEAFEGYPECEVSRILKDLAKMVLHHGMNDHSLFDVNGNKVGKFEVKE